MKLLMTQAEFDKLRFFPASDPDDELDIVSDRGAPSGYSLNVPLGNGDETIPITVLGASVEDDDLTHFLRTGKF